VIVWRKGIYYYAGTLNFLLGIASPSLTQCVNPQIGLRVNGRRIKMIIEVGDKKCQA
jgi:hypothetical protein